MDTSTSPGWIETLEPQNAKLATEFVSALKNATGLEVLECTNIRANESKQPEWLLALETPAGKLVIAVELLREAYPRDVRNAVWRLQGFNEPSATTAAPQENVIRMVVAKHLSPGARAELKERHIGFYDTSGSLFLRHQLWLINIERAPAKLAKKDKVPNLFTEAREKVTHALLTLRDRTFTGQELVTISETSAFTVSTVLHELQLREWVKPKGRSSILVRPELLLNAWAEEWMKRKEIKTRWHAYTPNPAGILAALSDRCERAGRGDTIVTGAAAANVLSPLLTGVSSMELIVPPGASEISAHLWGLRAVDSGSNVTLIERDGACRLFRRMIPGLHLWVASPFILYLDLLNGQGRNADLAKQFRADVLKIPSDMFSENPLLRGN